MNNDSFKAKTASGVLWKFCESSLSQIINFVISIILARMLLPEDYGIIALVSVFLVICDKLVVSGFATSLIQKKDADNKDFSTIFYFSLAAAFLLYTVLFFTAPFIAVFFNAYNTKLLVGVIRVMSIQVIIVAINSVQSAYVSRTMQFRRFFFSNLGGMVLSAVVGIWMAYEGLGVWALVGQHLVRAAGGALVLWFTVRWRPLLTFSLSRFKSLYSYGWKIFATSMIATLYNDLRSLVIGKFYTSVHLAFYNKGQSFPQLVESNITGTIDSVFFPAMARKQSSREEMLSMLRRTVKVSTYILAPLLMGLAAVSTPLVTVLLTEKWLPCVFFLQIISFSFVLAPVEIENLQAIKAIGRSDIVLKLEIVKKSIGVALLVVSIPFGVEAIAVSFLASNLLAAVLNAYPNRKLIGYKYRHQIKDVAAPLVMSALMYAAIYLIGNVLTLSAIALLFIQISAGIVVYFVLSLVTRNENLGYLFRTIKSLIKRRKNEPSFNREA